MPELVLAVGALTGSAVGVRRSGGEGTGNARSILFRFLGNHADHRCIFVKDTTSSLSKPGRTLCAVALPFSGTYGVRVRNAEGHVGKHFRSTKFARLTHLSELCDNIVTTFQGAWWLPVMKVPTLISQQCSNLLALKLRPGQADR